MDQCSVRRTTRPTHTHTHTQAPAAGADDRASGEVLSFHPRRAPRPPARAGALAHAQCMSERERASAHPPTRAHGCARMRTHARPPCTRAPHARRTAHADCAGVPVVRADPGGLRRAPLGEHVERTWHRPANRTAIAPRTLHSIARIRLRAWPAPLAAAAPLRGRMVGCVGLDRALGICGRRRHAGNRILASPARMWPSPGPHLTLPVESEGLGFAPVR